jgi:(2Fe-2S) ferredoxin
MAPRQLRDWGSGTVVACEGALFACFWRKCWEFGGMGNQRKIEKGFAKAGLPTAQRHVFLCAGPDCCSADEGQAAWDALKGCLKGCGLPVMRTKAACFRVCQGGPWLVVYPDGVWYGDLTPERVKRIVAEHLGAGKAIAEWIARVHPLEPEA